MHTDLDINDPLKLRDSFVSEVVESSKTDTNRLHRDSNLTNLFSNLIFGLTQEEFLYIKEQKAQVINILKYSTSQQEVIGSFFSIFAKSDLDTASRFKGYSEINLSSTLKVTLPICGRYTKETYAELTDIATEFCPDLRGIIELRRQIMGSFAYSEGESFNKFAQGITIPDTFREEIFNFITTITNQGNSIVTSFKRKLEERDKLINLSEYAIFCFSLISENLPLPCFEISHACLKSNNSLCHLGFPYFMVLPLAKDLTPKEVAVLNLIGVFPICINKGATFAWHDYNHLQFKGGLHQRLDDSMITFEDILEDNLLLLKTMKETQMTEEERDFLWIALANDLQERSISLFTVNQSKEKEKMLRGVTNYLGHNKDNPELDKLQELASDSNFIESVSNLYSQVINQVELQVSSRIEMARINLVLRLQTASLLMGSSGRRLT